MKHTLSRFRSLMLLFLGALPMLAVAQQTVRFALPTFSAYENGTNAIVVVTRTGGTDGIVTVNYSTLDGSAQDVQDYIAASGTLTFGTNEVVKTFAIPMVDNILQEPDEFLTVVLSDPIGASLGDQTNAQVVIFDDDTDIIFAQSSYQVGETDTNAVVMILRSPPSQASASVQAFTFDGTAAGGQDYSSVATNIVFTNGQSVAWLIVPIINDCLTESNETILLTLTNAIGARVGAQGDSTLTITNDDTGAGTIEFVTSGPATTFEGQTQTLRIPVARRCATGGGVSVNFRIINSTNLFIFCHGTTNASAGFDYNVAGGGTFGTLTWAGGDGANKTIDISILEDLDVELQESIWVQLEDPPTGGGVLGTNRLFEIQIVDNDLPAGAADFFYNRNTLDNPSPGANNTVYAIAEYSTANPANAGKVVIGGEFTAVNAIVRGGVARLNTDGTVDTGFDSGSGADGFVGAVLILPDQRVLIGGGFGSVDNISRRGIARLNQNGSLDPAFNPGAGTDGPIFAMSLLPDGRLLIAGDFTTYNNVPRRSVARLNSDGSLDGTFNPGEGADGPVYALALQADGRVVIGGSFTLVDDFPSFGVARLNIDGSVDLSFAPIGGADDTVYALAIQNDGRIIAGGGFSTYDGEPRRGVVRINTDGTLDPAFNPGAGVDGLVYSVDLQDDGRPLIGGDFSFFNGSIRTNLARLYPNGTLDTTFMDNHYNNAVPGPNGFVAVVKFLQDTNVFIGGNFSRVGVGFSVLSVIPRNNYAKILGGSTETLGNAPGNFELVSATYSVDENVLGGVISIRIRRLNGNLGSVQVPFFTFDGSAHEGVDYFGGAGFVTFDDCETLDQFFTIAINDNNIVDGNRTFRVALGAPISVGPTVIDSPALGFITSAEVTIVDNDRNHGTIGFASAVYSVHEGIGVANITVTRTNGSVGRVTVQYATSNGSAVAGTTGDYIAAADTLTFEPSQTVKTFPITIRNDTASEFEESINLRLFNVTGGASLGRTSAVVLINSDEAGRGSLSFATNEFTIDEAAGTATITLRRTSGSQEKVFVDVLTVDRPPGTGAAREGVDYTGTTNTITFQAGETLQTITVPILTDGLVEGTEYLDLILTNVTGGANIGYLGTAALKIVDDDFYGSLAFTDANLYVNETDGFAAITVFRAGGSAEEVSVDFTLTMGTASEGVDYVTTNGTLVFPDGSLFQTFTIPIQDDGQLEVNETIFLTLTNFAKASPGLITQTLLTIIDDEALEAPAGSVDTSFDPNPGPNGFVNAIALLTDGRLFAAGDFTVFNNVVRRRIARLHTDGSLDTSFNPGAGANDSINTIALQPDEKIIVGGRFTRMGNRNRNGIARLNPDGAVDTAFNPGAGADNPVLALAVDDDGTILIGGDFTTYNNVARSRIARLNQNGSLDAGFDPGNGANGAVQAIAVQPDGRIIVAGDFTDFDSQPANFIMRLHPSGGRDGSFQATAGPNGFVHAVVLQPDGRILIGGAFTAVGGQPRNGIARLNADGTLDASFNPGTGTDGDVLALALQPDGRIIVVGEFTHINGVDRNRIVRLNANGSLDLSINFGSGANSFIAATLIQPDDQIVIGGGFTLVNGFNRNYIARLLGGADQGPGTLEFSADSYVVNESNTNLLVQIIRSGGASGRLDVNFFTADGTATATKDYQAVNTTVTFLDGESIKTVAVPILDDPTVEESETLSVVLTNIVGEGTFGAQVTATITIVNDDARVGFTLANFFVNENVVGGQAAVAIERVGTTNGAVTVTFATLTNGTASVGQDFQPSLATVVFGPGVTNRTVTIPILEDPIVEGTETIRLALFNVAGPATLSPSNAVLNIIDNDFNSGNLTFSAPQFSANESATALTITILRTNGTTGVVSVDYATQNGTATAGQDYVGSVGRVVIGDGQSVATFSISLLDDFTIEGNETFQVTLSNPTGGSSISGPASAIGVIEENDFGPGSLDVSFNPGAAANGRVRSLALAPDGRIIAGGTFTSFDNTNRTNIARMNIDGSHDLTFDPGTGPNSFVSAVGVISDGRVVVGGSFTGFGGVTFRRVARLTTTGAPDLSYSQVPNFNAAVNALAVQFNDRVAVGGGFTQPRGRITQLRLDGSEDTSFDTGLGVNNVVHATVARPDGSVFIGGAFTTVRVTDTFQVDTYRVARLSNLGQVDTSFIVTAVTNGSVFALAVQSDGKVVVGGQFQTTNSSASVNIARLNLDGSLDTSFNPGTGVNGPVYALGLQPNGKIIIGGDFTAVNGHGRNRYARLLTSGGVDLTFDPGNGANNTVFTLVVLSDGNVLIGGDFTTVNGVPRGGVARIRANDQDARITYIQHLGSEVRVTLACTPGVNYVLQATTDLSNPNSWLSLTTNNATGSTLEFTDPNVFTIRQKFYRARQAGF
jgi:uncharacterized delta-60 repeat protein